MELISITADPLEAPSSTPPGPIIAASESAESGTMVITSELFSAISFEDEAALAPSPTISSTLVATTSKTVRECPSFIRFRTMGFPIIPNPIKPMSITKTP